MFSLKDKIAIITGGASGIGLAMSRRFAAAGAIVASEVSRPQPMYVEERPRLVVPADRTYLPPPRYIPQRQCYRVWDRTPYGMVERTVCR